MHAINGLESLQLRRLGVDQVTTDHVLIGLTDIKFVDLFVSKKQFLTRDHSCRLEGKLSHANYRLDFLSEIVFRRNAIAFRTIGIG